MLRLTLENAEAVKQFNDPQVILMEPGSGNYVKLQRLSKVNWGWVNLSRPNFMVTHMDTSGWPLIDFHTPIGVVVSTLKATTSANIILFDSQKEMLNFLVELPFNNQN